MGAVGYLKNFGLSTNVPRIETHMSLEFLGMQV